MNEITISILTLLVMGILLYAVWEYNNWINKKFNKKEK